MKRRIYLVVSWLIPLFLMTLIFYFSSQTSTDSTHVSRSLGGTVLEVIEWALSKVGLSTDHLPSAEDIDFFVRKTAHFTIYAALGASVCHAFGASRMSARYARFLSPLWCLIYSVTDEFHQFFTDGRSAKVADILLDTLGGIAGTLFVLLLWNRHTKRKQRSAAYRDVP